MHAYICVSVFVQVLEVNWTRRCLTFMTLQGHSENFLCRPVVVVVGFSNPCQLRFVKTERRLEKKRHVFLCQVSPAQHITSGPLSSVVTRSQTLCWPPPHQGLNFCLLTVKSDCSFPHICAKWRDADVAAELETIQNRPQYKADNCSRKCFSRLQSFQASPVRVAFQLPSQTQANKDDDSRTQDLWITNTAGTNQDRRCADKDLLIFFFLLHFSISWRHLNTCRRGGSPSSSAPPFRSTQMPYQCVLPRGQQGTDPTTHHERQRFNLSHLTVVKLSSPCQLNATASTHFTVFTKAHECSWKFQFQFLCSGVLSCVKIARCPSLCVRSLEATLLCVGVRHGCMCWLCDDLVTHPLPTFARWQLG